MNAQAARSTLFFLLFCGACFAFIIAYTNLSDEAYLSFRVIDNFTHGYGLRWNVDERVQAFSHPLWLLAHIPIYALIPNIAAVTMALSALCAIGALTLVVRAYKGTHLEKALLLLLPLTLAAPFGAFTITGMETPLSLLLLGCFIHELWRKAGTRCHALWLIAALCLLTRFDVALIILPALLVYSKKRLHLGKLLLAVSPALAWYLFSFIYYGFFLPNSFYARQNFAMDRWDYVLAGFENIEQFFFYDQYSFLFIAVALGYCAYLIYQRAAKRELVLLMAGMILQIAYLIYSGGDLPPGQRLVPSFFIAVFIFYISFRNYLAAYPALVVLALINLHILSAGLHYTWVDGAMRLAEQYSLSDIQLLERATALTSFKSFTWLKAQIISHQLAFSVIKALLICALVVYFFFRKHFKRWQAFIPIALINLYVIVAWMEYSMYKPLPASNMPAISTTPSPEGVFIMRSNVGISAYYAGPAAIIINSYATTDALLARIGTIPAQQWQHGMFRHPIPLGYAEARRSGELDGMSVPLARYYERLELLTSIPVFDSERLFHLLGFQFWWYDHYRDSYLNYDMKEEAEKVQEATRMQRTRVLEQDTRSPFPVGKPVKKRIRRPLTP